MPGKWTRNLIAISFRIYFITVKSIDYVSNQFDDIPRRGLFIVLSGTVFSKSAVDGTELRFVTLIRRSYGCCLNYLQEELTVQVNLWLSSPLYNRFSNLSNEYWRKEKKPQRICILGPKLLINYQILLKLLIEIIKHFS